jgi:ABC-type spermidine/putrescine transport system permease subunit II
MANGNGNLWSAAASVFVAVAVGVFTMIAVWEHKQRSNEHEEIAHIIQIEMQQLVCTSKLNVFVAMQPKDMRLTLQDIPSEYWLCMPRSLLPEPNKTVR